MTIAFREVVIACLIGMKLVDYRKQYLNFLWEWYSELLVLLWICTVMVPLQLVHWFIQQYWEYCTWLGVVCHVHLKPFTSCCILLNIFLLQCYDQYLLKSLRKAAEARGHSFWARGPDNAGSYNSRPHETGFFCDGGDYDGYYGRFFLNWYSQVLIDHGGRVLSLAKLAFEGTRIAAKVRCLTVGLYPCGRWIYWLSVRIE